MGQPLRVIEGSGSVLAAALSGSRRDLLVALRAQIAAEIDSGVPSRDLASLSLRLMAIAEELENLESDGNDDIGNAAEAPDEPWSAS